MRAAFVTTLSDNFLPGFLASTSSLLKTTPNFNYDIVIIELNPLSETSKNNILKLYPKVVFKSINLDDYPKTEYDRKYRVWDYNCGLRFDIFLLEEYDKIIFYDCDIIFNIDMRPLLAKKAVFGAVARPATRMLQFNGKKGFSAGLLLINKKFLNKKTRSSLIKLLKQPPPYDERITSKKWIGNEPLLNNFFKNKVTFLPKKYNFCIDEIDEKTFKQTLPNLHFIGHKKPWHSRNLTNQFDPYIEDTFITRFGKAYTYVLLRKLSKLFYNAYP